MLDADAFAQTPDTSVSLNFVNADIESVAKAVSEITGRNFIIDPRVKGTINIISQRPIARDQVYPTFLAALRLQGFAAVESGPVVKIVPEAEAKTNATPSGSKVTASGDRLVTQVIPLRYESATQVVTALRPLITANNTIAALPGTNTLVITDYADNLKRLQRVIEAVDQPVAGDAVVIPLHHASALDLVTMLNRLVGEAGTPAGEAIQRIGVVADARTNSIVVRTDSPARLARVRSLIAQLDVPTGSAGNINILYLKNADAVRVAQTLRASLTGEGGGPVAATPMTPLASGSGGPGGGSPATTPLSTSGPASSGSSSFSANGVTIQADPASNSLIITAPEALYNNIRAIVEKLDVRRAQVYVEALVVEVTADKAAEFGIQWQVFDGVNHSNTQGIGGTNFGARGSGTNIIDATQNIGSVGNGLNIGIVHGQITIPGLGTITNLGLLARALETGANANILSTPNLLTLDNEEARIVIGQNVPFITGQYAQTGTQATPTPFQTIERKDVGLTLRVRPQITEGGTVRMQIYQEVSSVQDTTNPAGVITNKRSLESTVLVDDAQIVVLGGLIQDSYNNSDQKVPVLGDVPGIGPLFRYENRKRTKTNLMVFLRPYVIRGASGGAALTADRYDFLIGEQRKTEPAQRLFWNDTPVPTMPPLPAAEGSKK
jgi:general secretion pathway protein D